ncbi:sigma-70 family RNA polymerase sigma factor [Evansella tamaricis]|uniref:Sigma-70 family RNA polymerase sigma factor n=1 Tax=Evansella tamaricis TaxID=2069301 RepID=A0ABS6JBM2_9BACI|nr:sigma-70 family RNA polymerase sigma factor [Evansella tamaricis]MBU9711077.1 sigma-70 family RNA polymerase sigma factor [Evansella tamaricis]
MDPKELENLISDYRWMKREVVRLDELVFRIGGTSGSERSFGVAQYGIEATMPKGSSIRSRAELDDLDNREKKLLKRLERYQSLIKFVEDVEDLIEEPKQQVIYSCMMEGLSYRAMGKHIGVSREQVRRIRDELINHLCQNCHLCQSWHYLKYQKQPV